MEQLLTETVRINQFTLGSILGLLLIFMLVFGFSFPNILGFILVRFVSVEAESVYHKIVAPYRLLLGITILLILVDLVILFLPTPAWLNLVEIPFGLSLLVISSWLAIQLFRQFFDLYLFNTASQSKQKLNSELLIIGKFLASTVIIVTLIIVFAQTHHINIIGIFASLGVGGLAVAFAAQKTLEQLLGGIVLYLDRPFDIDDYIGLPDGTFGKVETIGLRSTKIRASGKGTLIIVPNNALTQVNIENFTGAKKVISLLYLTFYRSLPESEKALIRQIILESTRDVFGIDSRTTEVIFKDISEDGKQGLTQAQINFFILGSGEVSMELRRQLLDIANQKITQQLKAYSIAFAIEEQTINVDSPITI